MKRLAALVLAALMILGMTACGQKKDESKSKLDQGGGRAGGRHVGGLCSI